jgi:peptidoglycan-associated lipoprotein
MRSHVSVTIILILAGLITINAGCSRRQQATPPQTPRTTTGPGTAQQPTGPSVTPQPQTPQASREAVPAQLSFAPIYYDYDASNIREDQLNTASRNALLLEKYPTVNIRIEGNCDERGSEEYNLSLGQRRADSFREYLVNYGIQSSRMTTVSYGEMRPVATGRDEAAFAQNRRCDIVITSR